jgi:hypothetical protein
MSRGQLPRTPEYFPRMNDRAGRRRYRRTIARAHRFAATLNGTAYRYGGHPDALGLLGSIYAVLGRGVMSEIEYRAEVGIE